MKHNGANDSAFPYVRDSQEYAEGMTMREWYAGKALRVVIEYGGFGEAEPDQIAKWAFEIADAMLAEGRKEAP